MTDAKETVHDPGWYTSGAVETIAKIEAVIDGLPAREAFLLGQVIRYTDRAGEKDDPATDLGKANNYAHRLVTKRWRDDSDPCRKGDGFNFVSPAAWPLRVKAVDCLRKCLKEVRRG